LFCYFGILTLFYYSLDLLVVNYSRYIVKGSKEKLVLTSIRKRGKLLGTNPWAKHGIVSLSRAYMTPPPSIDELEGEDDLASFMKRVWIIGYSTFKTSRYCISREFPCL
jgi:hypothetical protein